jgi:hypothetical protein
MHDQRWPRELTWPPLRPFDRAAALASVEATTTVAQQTVRDYDSTRKSTTVSEQTWYTPNPAWAEIARRPDLGREEGAFYYAILWKRPEATIEEAVAAPARDPLAAARRDLGERATPAWFDATAYWCSLAGMLSRADLARFVGDARVFVHSYRDGGTSIITSYGERIRFIESFYQTIVPYFSAAEWKIVSQELPAIDKTLLASKSSELAQQTLRLAAASGLFDEQVLSLIDAGDVGDIDVFAVLHALRDREHLRRHAKRLKRYTIAPLALEKWLDRFGDEEMAWVHKSLEQVETKKERAQLEAVLRRAKPAAEKTPTKPTKASKTAPKQPPKKPSKPNKPKK